MSKYQECERCPYEHTGICDTCLMEPVAITPEDAIKEYMDQNENMKMIHINPKSLPRYRINLMAIDAIREKYHLEAGEG